MAAHESLGTIHRQYNNTLKETIINNPQLDSEFKLSDNDKENLMKIDLANHQRNVEYILSVLKCEDALCVSRALKGCAWLVTEHAHIINPHYLHEHLFPHMTTKNYIKLIKYIKLTLKDEKRAEEFYLQEKNLKQAVKWLPLCSVPFVEHHIERHIGNDGHLDDLNVRTFKRLCEKSISIFELVLNKAKDSGQKRYLEAVTFLLHVNVDLFLDTLERVYYSERVKLSDHATDLIMKHSPKRVLDKFDEYCECVHVPTVARYLEKDAIKPFLYEQAKKDVKRLYSFYSNNLEYFVNRLPKDEQFQFIKDVFIDRVHYDVPKKDLLPDTEAYGMMMMCTWAGFSSPFSWYKYATFEIAHEAFIQYIAKDPQSYEKYGMVDVLLKCAGHNLHHIRTIIQYCLDDKIGNWDDHYKNQFIESLVSETHIYRYDELTWNVLNDLFKALNIYEENNLDDGPFVESIIIYSIVHDLTVPTIITNKFQFSTLISYKHTVDITEQEKIFSFVYEHLISLIKDPVVDEEQFNRYVNTLENILTLLLDWKKELNDYPYILNTIKEYITIKEEHAWKTNLSTLYNMNKRWRRLMFEESLSLSMCEETCLNALKHSPPLLARHRDELRALRASDYAAPRRLLAKLRLYWPDTIANEWINDYFKSLDEIVANKSLVRGLFLLLSREPLMNMININAPATARIDWTQANERDLSLRRFIAKNIHVARPQPTLDAVLLYAKGDYLKFALPSVLAIFYNLSPSQFRIHISKILNAPVSLQKHGLRFVYCRYNSKDVQEILLNNWKMSKNLSIRAVIFNFAYTLLCKEQEDPKIIELWELLESFIENLSFKEDKKIYELLFKVESVPLIIRGKYLMKCYSFLQNFLPHAKSLHADYEGRIVRLGEYSRNIIELVSADFVTNLINRFIEDTYFRTRVYMYTGMIQVISAYLLFAKDEHTQTQKYEQLLVPIMQRSFEMLNENSDDHFIKSNLQELIACLSGDLKYVVQKNMIIPTKMFVDIETKLNKSLPIPQHYMFLTKWRIIVALTKLIETAYTGDNTWADICAIISPEFGKLCVQYVKEDMKQHFSCIYILFAKAFESVLKAFIDEDEHIVVYKQFLSDDDFIEGYLMTVQQLAYKIKRYGSRYNDISELFSNHSSVEVRFQYSNRIAQQ